MKVAIFGIFRACKFCGHRIKKSEHFGWLHTEPGTWLLCPVPSGEAVPA